MGEDRVWDGGTQDELRQRLREAILGELRLSKRSHGEIVEWCRDVYILDGCPESEHDNFIRFALEELGRAEIQHQMEKVTWPEVTDCDRLDRVERTLQERGILFWQASPCCDTCTRGELPDRIAVLESRSPGFRDRIRGYSFFIDQNLPEMLAEDIALSVFLAYGWFSPDDAKPTPAAYQAHALSIAGEICECLREQQFEPNWDGSLNKKIGIALNWQRRVLLD